MALFSKSMQFMKQTINNSSISLSPSQMETLEAINHCLQSTYEFVQQAQLLSRLEEKLEQFEPETEYADIHNRMSTKYDLAKEYYKAIEEVRIDLITGGVIEECTEGKKDLIQKLDAVVTTIRTEFTTLIEEKYRLLDEIFVIKTNSNYNCDYTELAERVDEAVQKPKIIFEEEREKIRTVILILEDEEVKLTKLKQF